MVQKEKTQERPTTKVSVEEITKLAPLVSKAEHREWCQAVIDSVLAPGVTLSADTEMLDACREAAKPKPKRGSNAKVSGQPESNVDAKSDGNEDPKAS